MLGLYRDISSLRAHEMGAAIQNEDAKTFEWPRYARHYEKNGALARYKAFA